uniref:Uncharacterized protein n=1 Tax=Syphacia muris TaxID=451379 RepID=A0A0N5ASV4_9BILA
MLRLASLVKTAIRLNHKGYETTPPMRYFSVTQDICLFLILAGTCLSYPTYVLFNLKNLAPREVETLNPKLQADLDRRVAERERKMYFPE